MVERARQDQTFAFPETIDDSVRIQALSQRFDPDDEDQCCLIR